MLKTCDAYSFFFHTCEKVIHYSTGGILIRGHGVLTKAMATLLLVLLKHRVYS